MLVTVMVGAAMAQEAVYKIPVGQPAYFKSDYYTGSAYIEFMPDGKYRRINREHMFTAEMDNGTWKQDDSGLVTLISDRQVRNIECGPLTVYMGGKDKVEGLTDLLGNIKKFLQNNPGKTEFSPEQIENIRKVDGVEDICVDSGGDQISLGQVTSFSQTIQSFISDADKNKFHCTPMTYKNFIFLVWRDSEVPSTRDLVQVKESIDGLGKDEFPPYLYLATDQKTFCDETGTTYPFKFYPEMNKCLSGNKTEVQ